MSDGIEVERQGRMLGITLNYKPLNILGIEHIETLDEILNAIKEDMSVDLVWIRAGETKAFCAGVSITDHLPERAPRMLTAFRQLSQTLLSLPQVILTEVFGAVLGGGMELVLLSDLVVAADDTKFGQPEILLAATPPVAAALLPSRVGWQEASRLCLLGETLDAAWAQQRGLLTRMVSREQLRETAADLANRILKMSSPALRTTKRILAGRHGDRTMEVGYAFDLYASSLLPTEDAQEGIEAFLAKRPPVWRQH